MLWQATPILPASHALLFDRIEVSVLFSYGIGERRESDRVVRHTTFNGGVHSSALRVPTQCPFVLLAEVRV
jgi:hypothetical protein